MHLKLKIHLYKCAYLRKKLNKWALVIVIVQDHELRKKTSFLTSRVTDRCEFIYENYN